MKRKSLLITIASISVIACISLSAVVVQANSNQIDNESEVTVALTDSNQIDPEVMMGQADSNQVEPEPQVTIINYEETASSVSIINEGMPELTSVGVFEPEGEIMPLNVSQQVTNYTLKTGEQYVSTFDLSGWWGQPDHNRVNFIITSNDTYVINLTNTTTNTVIVSNESHTGSYGFTLLGTPDNAYRFAIVNPNATSITFSLTITSYYE